MRLVYFLSFSLIFIATITLSLPKPQLTPKPVTTPPTTPTPTPISTIMPVLGVETGEATPITSAQGVLAIDLNTNVVLYEKNPHLQLLPASTTKIMTALIALENYNENDVVTIGNINAGGKKMNLVYGEQITTMYLLYGALVPSANDAAEALAMAHPEGRDYFIDQMNTKAKELGMTETTFKNPSGLENAGHISSAHDMLILAVAAMKNPKFPKYVRTQKITVKSIDGAHTHQLANVNKLLGTVDGVLGVKTGWTENARENLVTYVQRGDKEVMIALMGSQDRFGETRELINWIFENYNWEEIHLPASGTASSP